MFCSKDILLSCCDLKMVLNAFHQWSPGPIFGPKIFIFLRFTHIIVIFGVRKIRLNGIISPPYPEVTLDNFGFPVGGRLAARRAFFWSPDRNFAILRKGHFPREVPLILDRGQRNLVGPSGPPII